MAAPLLGLASLLGREYAYTRPTYAEQDAIMKVVSPQTYYGNQLINYLTNKFNIDSDLSRAQNAMEQASRVSYDNGPKGISQEEYDRQMAELSAKVNAPENAGRIENYARDLDFGTISPVDSNYVGPQTEDSVRFQLGEAMLPRSLESVPVESNFTPAQLDALRERIYGVTPEVGPQQEPSQAPGGGGFGGAGSDFMPSGYEKNPFETSYEEIEQYLRGGVVGRRMA